MKYNWEVERSLLGGLMLDASQLAEVREAVRAEDFHNPRHGALFTLLIEVVERTGNCDVISVMDEVGRRDAFEDYGGAAYISGLPNACPSVENIESYAARVREHATRRNLVVVAEAIIGSVRAGEKDLPTLLDDAQREVFALSQLSGKSEWHALSEVIDKQFMVIQERSRNPGDVTGITTGFVDLDKKLAGFNRSDLIILAARPAMGKTALALNMAVAAADKSGVAVGIFTLEMSRQQLATRMLCAEAMVDASKVRTGHLDPVDDWRKLSRAAEKLSDLPIEIDDAGGLTISSLRSKARRLKAKRPELGLLIIDYLQLMEGQGGAKESRENAVSGISRGLKLLAKELDIPIVALSQLNRTLENRPNKRPQPSDLRESGSIEQDADIILFIYRDEVYHEDSPKKGLAEVIVAKNRSGAIGDVTLTFDGRWTLFRNYAGPTDSGYV